MTRRINLFLLILLILVGVPVWYLFIDSSPWSDKAARLDVAGARQLVAAAPGQKPDKVAFELVGFRSATGNLLASGSGFRPQLVGVMAYRLEVPGARPIMIDTGITPAYAQELGMKNFDAAAQSRVNESLREASLILVTHEHADHLGGLAALTGAPGGAALAATVRLNKYQVPGNSGTPALTWAPGIDIPATIAQDRPQMVAPGVVVLPTPGHTPGSQMIYVQLANGAELLFAGDTAPREVSWLERRPPSRFLTDFRTPQDRVALIGWLNALHDLTKSDPRLNIVPGHDLDWLIDPNNKTPLVNMRDKPRQKVAGK